MLNKISINDIIEKAIKIHGNKYDYSDLNYINISEKMNIICPIHGKFSQITSNHLRGFGCKKCGEKSRTNKVTTTNKDFIEKSKLIHGDKYDYSKTIYINSYNKIIIICPVHGEFKQRASQHLEGYNCNECSKKLKSKTTEEFIEKAKLIHGDKYDYSLVKYKNKKTKIKIICKIHGIFEQLPFSHRRGNGCKKCSIDIYGWNCNKWIDTAKKSLKFDSFKFYLIRCWNENEEFYKIGRTFKSIEERFKYKKEMPYNYEVIYSIYSDPEYIFKLEILIKSRFSMNKYNPNLSFHGKRECLNINLDKEQLINSMKLIGENNENISSL